MAGCFDYFLSPAPKAGALGDDDVHLFVCPFSRLSVCLSPETILGDKPLETTPPGDNSPGDNLPPRLGVLTLTDPQRGVLTLTLTLTDPRGRELSENWH